MEKSFNSKEYVQTLANELIESFAKANKATTPQLVGSAKEKIVRKQLELLLPNIVGVGTGCIIDADGHTSNQCDIVIYEKDFCPIFSINDNPETTYYPCESVIAVGEIKLSLNTDQLVDSFSKIKSVKSLKRRFSNPTPQQIGSYRFRSYGSRLIMDGAKDEAYNQELKYSDQIFAFILSEDIPLKTETFLEKYADLVNRSEAHLLPNITVSLDKGLFLFINQQKNKLYTARMNATGIQNLKNPNGDFQNLLDKLGHIIFHGRSTDVFPFKEYIHPSSSFPLNGPYKEF